MGRKYTHETFLYWLLTAFFGVLVVFGELRTREHHQQVDRIERKADIIEKKLSGDFYDE